MDKEFIVCDGYLIWDGSADTANKLFGEAYGEDWEYIGDSKQILVYGKEGAENKVYKFGDFITF